MYEELEYQREVKRIAEKFTEYLKKDNCPCSLIELYQVIEQWKSSKIEEVFDWGRRFENDVIQQTEDLIMLFEAVPLNEDTINSPKEYFVVKDFMQSFVFEEIYEMLETKGSEITFTELEESLADSIPKVFKHLIEVQKFNHDAFLNLIVDNKDRLYARYEGKNILIGFKDSDWSQKTMKNEIIQIFRKHDKNEFMLSSIVHRLLKNDNADTLPSPLTNTSIKEVIINNPSNFAFDEKNGLVKLKADVDSLKNYLTKGNSWNYERFSNFLAENKKNSMTSPAIVAIHFVGDEFPLVEAVEYVKIRPIIYLDYFASIKEGIEKFSDFTNKVNSEFLTILSSILPEDVDLKKWLENFISITIYYKNYDDYAFSLIPELINSFSPVLNLNNNPGNLFRITLEDKIAEYKNQLTAKVGM